MDPSDKPLQPAGAGDIPLANLKNEHHHRGLTDRLGCCFWLLVIGLFTLLLGYGVVKGVPERLIHGVDYQGRVCGHDVGVESTSFMYWCGVGQWVNPKGLTYPSAVNLHSKTCVKTCPTAAVPENIDCLMPNEMVTPQSGSRVVDGVSITETIEFEILQRVERQKSYPTIAVGGKCMPVDDRDLAAKINTNALGSGRPSGKFLASMCHSWWLFLPVWATVVVLCYIWLYLMKDYAGLVIFMQMGLTCCLVFGIGVYFLIGIFFLLYDPYSVYQLINPYFHAFDAWVAGILSFFTGLFIIAWALVITCIVIKEAEHIDEEIGLIAVSMECVFPCRCRSGECIRGSRCGRKGSGDLLDLPFWLSVAVTTIFLGVLYGFTYVESIGDVSRSQIIVNGEYVQGLYRALVFFNNEWWTPSVFYKLASCWFIETTISSAQFLVSYCVSQWYMTPVEFGDDIGAVPYPTGRNAHVRIAGADAMTGPRNGVISEDGAGHRILTVHVGKRGPGGKDYIPGPERSWHKTYPSGQHRYMCEAACALMGYHLGSIAKGASMIFFTRFPRLIVKWINALMVRDSANRKEVPMQTVVDATYGPGTYDRGWRGDGSWGKWLCNLLGLLGQYLDAMVGKYSKDAYIHMAIDGTGYFKAAKEAEEIVVNAGGIVSYMMGGCAIFEIVWISMMMSITFIVTIIIAIHVPMFADPGSLNYIGDPGFTALMASVLGGLITYMFVLVVSHTGDTLLFNFAVVRDLGKQKFKGNRSAHSAYMCMFMPPSLSKVVETVQEAEVHPNEALVAKGTRMDHFYNHGAHMFSETLGFAHPH